MMERVAIEVERIRPKNYKDGSNDLVKSKNTVHMIVVNEIGIYEALYIPIIFYL